MVLACIWQGLAVFFYFRFPKEKDGWDGLLCTRNDFFGDEKLEMLVCIDHKAYGLDIVLGGFNDLSESWSIFPRSFKEDFTSFPAEHFGDFREGNGVFKGPLDFV